MDAFGEVQSWATSESLTELGKPSNYGKPWSPDLKLLRVTVKSTKLFSEENVRTPTSHTSPELEASLEEHPTSRRQLR